MPYTERSKPQVVLNKMTKAVYDSIEKDPDQLYAVTDADIYDLPVASADTLGGIKVGQNLTIEEDGTLNAQAGSATEVIEMFDLDSATAQEIADAITASSGETTTAIEVISVMKYGFRKPDGSLIDSFSNLRREVYNGNLPFEYKVDSGKMQNLPFLSRIYTQSTRATTVETSLYYANSMSKTNINFTADTEHNNKFWYAYSNDLDDDTYAVTIGNYVSEDISQEGGIGAGFMMEDINGDLYMGNSLDETKKISPNEKELTQVEYDALTDEQKNNGTTYYITDASNRQNDVYSISEQPVGTWVDGKTIYRKTVAFGALPNATSKRVAHNISNLDYVVKIEGSCLQGAGYKNIPLVYKGSDSTYNVEFSVDATHIEAVSNQDRSGNICPYVTIYYTKN